MDYQPPPFFNQGPSLLARLTFFVVFSLLLMASDARFNHLRPLRQALTVVVHPLQYIANLPGIVAKKTGDFFVSQEQLQKENAKLRQHQLFQAARLQQYQVLQAENAYLHQLLDVQQRLSRSYTLTQILNAGQDPFARKVIIDKGTFNQLKAGLVAVDSIGVVGQLTRVYPFTSEVTLITDKDHAVPVEIVRNGLRAVVFGAGQGGTLELRYMPVNADIQNGDQLVTSGIDGTYPAGLPVAVVSKIEHNAAVPFAKIICSPSAGIDRHKQLLILSELAKKPPMTNTAPAAVTK